MPGKGALLMILLFGIDTASLATGTEAPPDAALLEFLGEWSDENGDFIDPLAFAEDEEIPALPNPGETRHDD